MDTIILIVKLSVQVSPIELMGLLSLGHESWCNRPQGLQSLEDTMAQKRKTAGVVKPTSEAEGYSAAVGG